MIRAGISGTNGTGKSTIIRTFVDGHPDLRVDVVSLSTLVDQCPFPMIEQQAPEGSRWILSQLTSTLKRVVKADVQLLDRSFLDILAFTQYAFDRAAKSADETLLSAIHSLASSFDFVFYATITDDWPLGGTRPPRDMAFALLMDWYMRKAISKYDIAVVYLPSVPTDSQRVLSEYLDPSESP